MTLSHPVQVGAVIFEGFELLDLYGPLEMFGLLEADARITLVGEKTGAVRSFAGPQAVAEVSLSTCEGFDILVIPGGLGTRVKVKDAAFIAEIRRLADRSTLVATACTGSMLLAATGLLDGLNATTNKRVFGMIRSAFPSVRWASKARWVADGKYVTASGISAGTDMSLAVIAGLFGRQRSLEIARRAEYEWNEDPARDPFAAE
jgi:transcriptional regulator GlxA family with amidase domain